MSLTNGLTHYLEAHGFASFSGAAPPSACRPTMAQIIARTAEKYGTTPEALKSPTRLRPIAQARQEAMWHCVQEHRWSLPQIGRVFNRDHTTVMHGRKAHEKRMASL